MARLLAESGLPTDDLYEQDLALFLIEDTGDVVYAVGGLERCGDTALIRSIATSNKLRGRGIARALVSELEKLAVSHGLKELYLLTESAEGYFQALEYVSVDRSDVPQSIRDSRQFSSLCPDSAAVMYKRVDV